ncbi:hypothetical protein VNO77_02377 [Canavalia gladiata]|uniref:Uncharacterized protein n=1 Tax=Canavalia gladiata TaxID=3824 RepID=A0AAN9MTJ5_CANGL
MARGSFDAWWLAPSWRLIGLLGGSSANVMAWRLVGSLAKRVPGGSNLCPGSYISPAIPLGYANVFIQPLTLAPTVISFPDPMSNVHDNWILVSFELDLAYCWYMAHYDLCYWVIWEGILERKRRERDSNLRYLFLLGVGFYPPTKPSTMYDILADLRTNIQPCGFISQFYSLLSGGVWLVLLNPVYVTMSKLVPSRLVGFPELLAILHTLVTERVSDLSMLQYADDRGVQEDFKEAHHDLDRKNRRTSSELSSYFSRASSGSPFYPSL